MRRSFSGLGVVMTMLVACDQPLAEEERRPTVYGELWKELSKAAEDPRDVVLTKNGWVRGRTPEGLAAMLSRSGRGRGVVVYAYADWYVCGGPFENAVLLNSSVRSKLERYTLVLVDVTDPTPDERALQDLLGFGSISVFENGDAVAESLRSGRKSEARARMDIDFDDEVDIRRRFLALLESTRSARKTMERNQVDGIADGK